MDSPSTELKPWGIHAISDVIGPPEVAAGMPDGTYGKAVPEPYTGNRLRAAWWVLTGRAYALRWPTDVELNRALGWKPGNRRSNEGASTNE